MREFRDRHGRHWRVWEVIPEAIHPLTKAEDYLAECYRDGWLAFETLDGVDKRRLCPPPYAWDQRTEEDLAQLAERAERLRPAGGTRPRTSGPADLPPSAPSNVVATIPRDEEGNLDSRYLGVVRTFLYPGGQVWRAHVVAPDDLDTPSVLRFSSDTHVIDLTEWPADWLDLRDSALLELLHIGKSMQERRQDAPLQRRHDDPDSDA